MTWSIAVKTEDEKTRLQALALINDVNKYRTDLVTNGVIVNNALQIVQSKLEHLNGKGKGKGEDIEDINKEAEEGLETSIPTLTETVYRNRVKT